MYAIWRYATIVYITIFFIFAVFDV